MRDAPHPTSIRLHPQTLERLNHLADNPALLEPSDHPFHRFLLHSRSDIIRLAIETGLDALLDAPPIKL